MSSQDGELQILQDRATDDVNALPAKYDALAADIEEYIPFTPNGRVYITQYPDPTRDSSGAHCDEMLTDVIPGWISPRAPRAYTILSRSLETRILHRCRPTGWTKTRLPGPAMWSARR